ncbi:hypothetical protein BRADI_3g30721v3 [Brachypodium distachyon]|uniref:Uncharacterized protein n=1 Tax=Brachypodium distachyon TaxID=15368 RepID=A0A0Q3FE26_BRADI|nr:hypothetical protein BRADI_3g30721v3 [Brachypodium distachyon]
MATEVLRCSKIINLLIFRFWLRECSASLLEACLSSLTPRLDVGIGARNWEKKLSKGWPLVSLKEITVSYINWITHEENTQRTVTLAGEQHPTPKTDCPLH